MHRVVLWWTEMPKCIVHTDEIYKVVRWRMPEQLLVDKATRKKLTDQFKKAFKLPMVDLLACDCEIQRQERSTIMALERPKHPFSRSLVEVAKHIGKK